MVTVDSPIEREKWIPVSLRMDMNNNSIAVNYNGKDTTIMVPLSGSTHVRALFGHAPEYLADVAPVNIKDVKCRRTVNKLVNGNFGNTIITFVLMK